MEIEFFSLVRWILGYRYCKTYDYVNKRCKKWEER